MIAVKKPLYYLMNKDRCVLSFSPKREAFSDDVIFEEISRFSDVPFGFGDIDSWIENRKASKHNEHLKKIMEDHHCNDHEGFVRLTHAANINDTFWVKREDEIINWNDVSLYDNEFSTVISELAFGGAGLGENEQLSSTSPELTCDGSFRKCFRKEKALGQFGSDIYIYKRRGELNNEGLTPYCEMLASEISAIISPDNYVDYRITYLHDKLASRCNLFTNEKQGYASFSKVHGNKYNRLQPIFEYYRYLGSEQQFRELLVIDSLCFNIDRHRGNFGIIFDNDTLKPISIAPAFDFNLSMLYNFTDDELMNANSKMYDLKPKLGDDFTRIGQQAMNSVIAERVRKIKNLSFSFKGDDTFIQKRLERIFELICIQADAILSDTKMYIKDVFVSEKTEAYRQKEQEYNKAIQYLDTLTSLVEKEYPDVLISSTIAKEDSETFTVNLIIEGTNSTNNYIEIDFLNRKISTKYSSDKFADVEEFVVRQLYELTGYKEFGEYYKRNSNVNPDNNNKETP